MLVSVEVGHSHLGPGPVFNSLAVQRSIDISKLLEERLQADWGADIHHVVLVDDKDLPARRRPEGARVLVGAIDQQLRVDQYFPEHRLKAYRDQLVALLPGDGLRRRVEQGFNEDIEEHGHLMCSADIGIWHALRLGYITDRESFLVEVGSPFEIPDIAVSILPEGDRESEIVARDRYVKYLPDGGEHRIHRLYYPTDPEQPFDPAAHVTELTQAIAITREAVS